MSIEFERNLEKYAELAVKVGLNLQPGQRLLIGAPLLWTKGAPIQSAPLVRLITASAYKAGAKSVDVMWDDDQSQLVKYRFASRDSFTEYPAWQVGAAQEHARRGDAILVVLAEDPDLLREQDPELVALAQKTAFENTQPVMDCITQNMMNWVVVSASVPGWAAKVFPDDHPRDRDARLWDAIFDICRVKQADPVSGWRDHTNELVARGDYLNHKQYAALKLTAPGTDLSIGLPKSHIWRSGRMTSRNGIPFTANMPTEEVFTMPHKDKTKGVVASTRPLSLGGTLIENFSLTFADGRVVKASAARGEEALKKLLDTDEGAGRLGEVALVPHSSPVSQSGLLFYNILIDENAASHIALGRAYKFSMENGETMSDEEFGELGGNHSLVHIDFMIGSGEMDVDGLTGDGTVEPLMHGGEWAFDV